MIFSIFARVQAALKRRIAKFIFKIIHGPEYKSFNPGIMPEFRANFRQFDSTSVLPEANLIVGAKYISIGKNFYALYNLRLEAWDSYSGQVFTPQIIIGENVNMNTDCHISCIDKIIIGDNVLMASRIYISDHSHGQVTSSSLSLPPAKRPLFSKGPVIIEKNVWIGEGVCILPNVTIGENSIIGANAVVTKSVPANSVVGGNPAKIIRAL
jgi:acetyltransferase-like isoleucine patch superfamily enzyme